MAARDLDLAATQETEHQTDAVISHKSFTERQLLPDDTRERSDILVRVVEQFILNSPGLRLAISLTPEDHGNVDAQSVPDSRNFDESYAGGRNHFTCVPVRLANEALTQLTDKRRLCAFELKGRRTESCILRGYLVTSSSGT